MPSPGIGHNSGAKRRRGGLEDQLQLSDADYDGYLDLIEEWRVDPVLYVRQRLGMNPTWQQEKIIDAIGPPGAKVTVRSGHGIGKSSALSGALLWHQETQEFARAVCTAPTKAQLTLVLWGELAKWRRKSDEAAAKMGLPRALWLTSLIGMTAERMYDVGAPQEWYTAARASRKENPDALQGMHASDVDVSADGQTAVEAGDAVSLLFCLEEASGVPDVVIEVAEGALSSPGSRLVMAGNPTRTSGFFFNSHHKSRGAYSKILHFRSSDSPLVDKSYRANLVRKYGEGSNIVRVRADGEFPKQDDDVLIALEHAEAAVTREVVRKKGKRKLGVDVARYGNDRTVLLMREENVVEAIEIYAKLATTATTGHVIKMARDMKADEIYVDENGVGAGVLDELLEAQRDGHLPNVEIYGVMVSEAPPPWEDGLIDQRPRKLRDHLWIVMGDYITYDEPTFALCERDRAEDLAGELSVVMYSIDSKGLTFVESKDDMKKRLGFSPDIADALMVTFYQPVVYRTGRIKVGGL